MLVKSGRFVRRERFDQGWKGGRFVRGITFVWDGRFVRGSVEGLTGERDLSRAGSEGGFSGLYGMVGLSGTGQKVSQGWSGRFVRVRHFVWNQRFIE